MKKLCEAIKDFFEDVTWYVGWFWTQIRRTDCGDDEHYPNGFRKLSCMEPIQIFRFVASIICLILSLIYAYVSKR